MPRAPRRKARRSIPRETAAADVDRFFHLLEHGWCGYGYFSRDHDFAAARRAIHADLTARESWRAKDLATLIRRRLEFVTDAHLKLGDVKFADHEDYLSVPDLAVTEQDGSFFIGEPAAGRRIVAVNGSAPGAYVFRSLDADGRASLALGVLSAVDAGPLTVTVEADGTTTERSLTLKRSRWPRPELFRFFRLGGLPVVRISTFSDHHVEQLDTFLRTAVDLRDEPCIIVDLRGNGGGNTRWAREWIRRLTGRTPELHQALSEFVSRTSLVGQANYMAWLAAGPGQNIHARLEDERARLAERLAAFDAGGARPYWQAPYVPTIQDIPNDVTLVVITDAAVASAGEGFLSFLQDQVENVVLVGENTRGALTFGHMSVHRLPGSGLLSFLPVKLNAPLDLKLREARGYEPDYWVPAADALNRAVAAIRAGTIPTVRPLPATVRDASFTPEKPHWFTPEQARRLREILVVIAGLGCGLGLGYTLLKAKRGG